MFARITKKFIGRAAVTALALGALGTAVAPAAGAAGYTNHGFSRAGAGILSRGVCGVMPATNGNVVGGAREFSITIASKGFEYISIGIHTVGGGWSWGQPTSVSQSFSGTIPISGVTYERRVFGVVGWDAINSKWEQTLIYTYFDKDSNVNDPWSC